MSKLGQILAVSVTALHCTISIRTLKGTPEEICSSFCWENQQFLWLGYFVHFYSKNVTYGNPNNLVTSSHTYFWKINILLFSIRHVSSQIRLWAGDFLRSQILFPHHFCSFLKLFGKSFPFSVISHTQWLTTGASLQGLFTILLVLAPAVVRLNKSRLVNNFDF